MMGAWPPCSVVQVRRATSYIVGSRMAATPRRKAICGQPIARSSARVGSVLTRSKITPSSQIGASPKSSYANPALSPPQACNVVLPLVRCPIIRRWRFRYSPGIWLTTSTKGQWGFACYHHCRLGNPRPHSDHYRLFRDGSLCRLITFAPAGDGSRSWLRTTIVIPAHDEEAVIGKTSQICCVIRRLAFRSL